MNENKWYVITGTLSSGKTATINLLKEKGYKIVPELARVYVDEQIKLGRTVEDVRKNELDFQHRILEMKIEREKLLPINEIVFFDRAIPDTAAYYKIAGLEGDEYLDFSIKKSKYKKVFLLSMLDYKKDYARVESEEERIKIHEYLKQAYMDYGFDVVAVPVFDTKEERVNFILNNL